MGRPSPTPAAEAVIGPCVAVAEGNLMGCRSVFLYYENIQIEDSLDSFDITKDSILIRYFLIKGMTGKDEFTIC